MRREYVIVLTVIAVIVAGVVGYLVLSGYSPLSGGSAGENVVVVYTYESLLAWGPDPDAVYKKVFDGFTNATGIKVEIRKFSDAGEMLSEVIRQVKEGKVEADVVIGIDNIQIIKAKEEGVLEPFIPSNIGEIYEWLVQDYDPEHYAIPYDYGVIAFVYDTNYINPDQMSNLTFESFYGDLGKTLVVEDPRTSSTGLAFLLYQIGVYEKYLGKDWTQWWRDVKPKVVKSWGDAYDLFLNEQYHIVVSYGTDPAYSYFFYNSTRYGAALATYNGKPLAWLQIEGIGIVKGAPHRKAAEKFVEWFLSKDVQEEIPLNNWMYPANKNVELPEAYKYAINPLDVELVNNRLTQEEIATNLDNWINEWLSVVSG